MPNFKDIAIPALSGLGATALYDQLAYPKDYRPFDDYRRGLNTVFNMGLSTAGASMIHHGHGATKMLGAGLMTTPPIKDLALMAQKPLQDASETSKTIGRNSTIGTALGAGALGLGGLALAKYISSKAKHDGPRVKVTLPTKSPHDNETIVDLPLDDKSLPPATQLRMYQQLRRKLRAETRERALKRDLTTGKLIPLKKWEELYGEKTNQGVQKQVSQDQIMEHMKAATYEDMMELMEKKAGLAGAARTAATLTPGVSASALPKLDEGAGAPGGMTGGPSLPMSLQGDPEAQADATLEQEAIQGQLTDQQKQIQDAAGQQQDITAKLHQTELEKKHVENQSAQQLEQLKTQHTAELAQIQSQAEQQAQQAMAEAEKIKNESQREVAEAQHGAEIEKQKASLQIETNKAQNDIMSAAQSAQNPTGVSPALESQLGNAISDISKLASLGIRIKYAAPATVMGNKQSPALPGQSGAVTAMPEAAPILHKSQGTINGRPAGQYLNSESDRLKGMGIDTPVNRYGSPGLPNPSSSANAKPVAPMAPAQPSQTAAAPVNASPSSSAPQPGAHPLAGPSPSVLAAQAAPTRPKGYNPKVTNSLRPGVSAATLATEKVLPPELSKQYTQAQWDALDQKSRIHSSLKPDAQLRRGNIATQRAQLADDQEFEENYGGRAAGKGAWEIAMQAAADGKDKANFYGKAEGKGWLGNSATGAANWLANTVTMGAANRVTANDRANTYNNNLANRMGVSQGQNSFLGRMAGGIGDYAQMGALGLRKAFRGAGSVFSDADYSDIDKQWNGIQDRRGRNEAFDNAKSQAGTNFNTTWNAYKGGLDTVTGVAQAAPGWGSVVGTGAQMMLGDGKSNINEAAGDSAAMASRHWRGPYTAPDPSIQREAARVGYDPYGVASAYNPYGGGSASPWASVMNKPGAFTSRVGPGAENLTSISRTTAMLKAALQGPPAPPPRVGPPAPPPRMGPPSPAPFVGPPKPHALPARPAPMPMRAAQINGYTHPNQFRGAHSDALEFGSPTKNLMLNYVLPAGNMIGQMFGLPSLMPTARPVFRSQNVPQHMPRSVDDSLMEMGVQPHRGASRGF